MVFWLNPSHIIVLYSIVVQLLCYFTGGTAHGGGGCQAHQLGGGELQVPYTAPTITQFTLRLTINEFFVRSASQPVLRCWILIQRFCRKCNVYGNLVFLSKTVFLPCHISTPLDVFIPYHVQCCMLIELLHENIFTRLVCLPHL
jgi:hypothetical protein